jgi:hypothetical protein
VILGTPTVIGSRGLKSDVYLTRKGTGIRVWEEKIITLVYGKKNHMPM